MPDRAGFALAFADKTGLDPEVVLGWTYWENTDDSEKRRPYNWLNWKKDVDIEDIPFTNCDPALDGGCFPGYAGLWLGLQAAVKRFNRPRYDDIRATVGKSQEEQLAAIRASDWGTHNITSRKFSDNQLMWAWINWRLGEGWAKAAGLGKKNMTHRPLVFPQVIPLTWWVKLATILAGRKK